MEKNHQTAKITIYFDEKWHRFDLFSISVVRKYILHYTG